MSPNPFVFIIQVKKCNCHCYRSDNRFLLLLPFPTDAVGLFQFVDDVFMNLLALAGDIELNPGPGQEALLEKLLKGQQEIAKAVTDIHAKQSSIDGNFAKLNEHILALENRFDGFCSLPNDVRVIDSELTSLKTTVNNLAQKLDNIENRGRRNNLLIFGFRESPDELPSTLLESIKKTIFQAKLGIDINGIERCHRLGIPKNGKVRPVILKLLDFHEKIAILKNCKKLKGSGLSIGEDYLTRVRQVRSNLWKGTEALHSEANSVRFAFDKLVVDGITFSWDSAQNKIRQVGEPGK